MSGAGQPQKITIVCTGKQGPVPDGSPATPCPACWNAILPGQFFTTIPVGPGGNPAQRALARQGAPCKTVSVCVHWACVSGDDTESALAI